VRSRTAMPVRSTPYSSTRNTIMTLDGATAVPHVRAGAHPTQVLVQSTVPRGARRAIRNHLP